MKKKVFYVVLMMFLVISCGDGKAVPGDLPELEWSEKAENRPLETTEIIDPEGDPYDPDNRRTIYPAISYCEELAKKDGATEEQIKDGDKTIWHIPSIDELRTLIIHCPDSEYQGACPISEEVNQLSYTEDWNADKCSGCGKGDHSKLDDTGWFWSYSFGKNRNTAWAVNFDDAYIYGNFLGAGYSVRCVRNK